MAYIPPNPEDEQDQNGVPRGTTLAAASPAPASPVGGPPAPAPVQASNSSGRFVNFDRYLAANKDAATAYGGKMAGQAEAGGQAVLSGLSGMQTGFGNKVNAGTPWGFSPYQQPTSGAVLTPPGAGPKSITSDQGAPNPRAGPSSIARVGPPPASLTPDQARAKAASAVYSGPGSLSEMSGYDALIRQANTATGRAHALTTSGGRMALGGEAPGAGRFSSGLTGATSGGRFAELARKWGDLGGRLGTANTASGVQADAAKAQAADVAGKYGAYADKTQTDMDAKAASDAAEKARWEAKPLPGKEYGGFFNPGPAQRAHISNGVYNAMTPEEVEQMNQLTASAGWGGLGAGFGPVEEFGKKMTAKYGKKG